MYERHNEQGPTVDHCRELYSVFRDNSDEKRSLGRMNACVYITESLCGTPETITIL